jgi:hypothetical protein
MSSTPPRPRPLLLPLCLLAAVLSPSWALADDEDEIRTVVVGLEGRRNVEEELALAMSDVVQGEIGADPNRKVFGRTDLQRVLAFESERQALGCNDDSCLTELAAALAVDRIVTGSIDRIGSQYFVVITEIDAQTVEPLGRVQRRLPLDENKLIDGILSMTRQLMQESRAKNATAVSATGGGTEADGSTTSAAGGQSDGPPPDTGPLPALATAGETTGPAGSVLITTDPSGLEVLLDKRIMGVTPLKLQDVPQGTAALTVRTLDGKTLPIDVPVAAREQTRVSARLDVDDDLTPDEQARFEEKQSDHLISAAWIAGAGAGVGGGCGILSFVVGLVIGIGAGDPVSGVVLGLGCCALPLCGGVALLGYAGYDYFFNAPEVPLTDGKLHIVELNPQTGDPIIFEVDADAPEGAYEDDRPADDAYEDDRPSDDAYEDDGDEDERRDDRRRRPRGNDDEVYDSYDDEAPAEDDGYYDDYFDDGSRDPAIMY